VWSLPSEDGDLTHEIVVRAIDSTQLEGASLARPVVRIDNVGPSVSRFVINNDDQFTESAPGPYLKGTARRRSSPACVTPTAT
jgi:hypothetical protein